MALTNMDKVFTLNENEHAFAYEDFLPVCAKKKIHVVCPKVMGALTKVGKDNIQGNGIFDNAPDCKINFNKKVNFLDYMSASVKENCNWMDKLNSSGMVPKNSTFSIEFVNGNILDPFITTK